MAVYQVFLCHTCEHAPNSISNDSDEQTAKIFEFMLEQMRTHGPSRAEFRRFDLAKETYRNKVRPKAYYEPGSVCTPYGAGPLDIDLGALFND